MAAPKKPTGPTRLIGSSATGRISKVAPTLNGNTRKPDPQLAGDTIYKGQRDAAHKALSDYATEMASSQNQYNTDYTRNMFDTNAQEKVANVNQSDDYASRGMSHSGLRARAGMDIESDFDRRKSTLDADKGAFGSGIATGLQSFNSTQRLNDTRYRNEAINRRAEYKSAGLP